MTSARIAMLSPQDRSLDRHERTIDSGWSLSESSARLRSWCPGAHGPRYAGFWVVTDGEAARWVVRDWARFAAVPAPRSPDARPPAAADAAEARLGVEFRSLLDTRPAQDTVEVWAERCRGVADRLLDAVVGRGEIDFSGEFVRPFLGTALFGLVLDAPDDEVERLAAAAALATGAGHPQDTRTWAWAELTTWIEVFRSTRTDHASRGGVRLRSVGRTTTRGEAVGVLQLQVLGWLETLGDAMNQLVHQLGRYPSVLQQLREQRSLVPVAVDRLLQTDAATTSVARVVTEDVEIGGHRLVRGDRVLACLPSGDHGTGRLQLEDRSGRAAEGGPDTSGLDAHRCIRPGIARTTLQVALGAIVDRAADIRVEPEAQTTYGSAFPRATHPLRVTVS